MSLIQKPDIGLRLKKFLGLTALPDSVLAPETVAVIMVGNLIGDTQDRRCMGTVGEAGAVGDISIGVLRNTPAAGVPRDVTVRVTKCTVTVDTDTVIVFGNTGVALGALGAGEKAFTDLDIAGAPASEVGSISQVAVPAMNNLVRAGLLASVPFIIPLNFLFGTVAAGQFQNALLVRTVGTDIALDTAWEWTEFSPEPS